MLTQLHMSGSQKPNKTKSKLFFISNDDPGLTDKSKQLIEEKLGEEYDYLIYKRRKEQEKKEKLKKMEDEFQKLREQRIRKLSKKIFQSTQLKQKNLEAFHKKMKHQDDRYKEIRNKIHHRTLDELEKSLSERQHFQEDNKKKSQNITMSPSKQGFGRSSIMEGNSKINQLMMRDQLRAEKSKKKLSYRLEKAESKKKSEMQKILSKKKEQFQQFEGIKDKIKVKAEKEEQNAYRQYYKKARNLEHCRTLANQTIKKQSQLKKRQDEQKFKKWQQNIYRVSQEKQRKLQALHEKLMQNHNKEKKWKNEREQVYLQLVNKNTQELLSRKEKRNERIMSKHVDIKLRNQIYKEKKHSMLHAVKTLDTTQ